MEALRAKPQDVRNGFTLIELMIVIAIIAVVAAIAIPGLLAAQRSANERSASATLKTLTTAQADFRANDRDSNRIRDYWTGDIFALYGMYSANTDTTLPPDGETSASSIKLVEPSVAGADGMELATAPNGYGNVEPITSIGVFSPKAGYVYRVFSSIEMETITPLQNDTDGPGFFDAMHDTERFAIMAFPETLANGRNLFVVSQDFIVYKLNLSSSYASGYSGGTTSTSAPVNTGQGDYFDNCALYPRSPAAVGCSKLD